jgi:hypothetical protein
MVTHKAATLFAGVVLISAIATAKCANGTVMVQGKIAGDYKGSTEITVVVRTPKGDFSRTTGVIDKSFRVDVPFSTLKYYFPLLGHRCTNLPETVDVKMTQTQSGALLAEQALAFRDSFSTQDSLTYTWKRELTLRVGKKK